MLQPRQTDPRTMTDEQLRAALGQTEPDPSSLSDDALLSALNGQQSGDTSLEGMRQAAQADSAAMRGRNRENAIDITGWRQEDAMQLPPGVWIRIEGVEGGEPFPIAEAPTLGASSVAQERQGASGQFTIRPEVGVVEDVARSIPAGLAQGVTAIAGLPGTIQQSVSDLTGMPRGFGNPTGRGYASTRDLDAMVQDVAGEYYEPQTVPGEYARTIAQNVPGALVPGGVATRAASVLAPALMSETAGQVARQVSPENEQAARLAGGLIGGFGAGASTARTAPMIARETGNALGRRVAAATPEASGNPLAGRHGMVQALTDSGVYLTTGQRTGGLVQNFENLAQRAPILGPAIRGARSRGVESLNRAVGNRALSHVGQGVPRDVEVGGDLVGYVGRQLGQEFEKAAELVPQISATPELQQNILGVVQQRIRDLPEAQQAQIGQILQDRLTRLDQPMTGVQYRRIEREVGRLADRYSRSADAGQQEMGSILEDVGAELRAHLGRANPEAGAILQRADEGWKDFVRMRAASVAAGGRPFAPGQLASAVRTQDASVAHGAVGRGEARLQDLSRAAETVMPDQFGNPGTADAASLYALLGYGLADPLGAMSVGGGLSVAALPYAAAGRRIATELPAARGPGRVQQALSRVAATDPGNGEFLNATRGAQSGALTAPAAVTDQETPDTNAVLQQRGFSPEEAQAIADMASDQSRTREAIAALRARMDANRARDTLRRIRFANRSAQ